MSSGPVQTLAAPARSAYLTDGYPLVDPIASPATGGTPSEVDSPADSTVAPPDGLTTSEPAEVAPDSGTGGSDGLGTGAVVGIVAAAVALVAAAIVIVVIAAKKNRKRKSASTGPMHGPGAAEVRVLCDVCCVLCRPGRSSSLLYSSQHNLLTCCSSSLPMPWRSLTKG